MRRRPVWPKLPAALWPIGLGLLLAALLYGIGLHGWLVAPAWRERQEMATLRQQQAMNAARLALRPEWQRRLAGLQRQPSEARDFLPDDDPSTASADLMQRVVASVAAHGGPAACEVTQKIPVAMDREGQASYREVRVTINLRCDPAGLAAVLYDLEYGHPYIYISDFVMYPNAQAFNDAADPRAEVQFTVAGFLRVAAAAASPEPAP